MYVLDWIIYIALQYNIHRALNNHPSQISYGRITQTGSCRVSFETGIIKHLRNIYGKGEPLPLWRKGHFGTLYWVDVCWSRPCIIWFVSINNFTLGSFLIYFMESCFNISLANVRSLLFDLILYPVSLRPVWTIVYRANVFSCLIPAFNSSRNPSNHSV